MLIVQQVNWAPLVPGTDTIIHGISAFILADYKRFSAVNHCQIVLIERNTDTWEKPTLHLLVIMLYTGIFFLLLAVTTLIQFGSPKSRGSRKREKIARVRPENVHDSAGRAWTPTTTDDGGESCAAVPQRAQPHRWFPYRRTSSAIAILQNEHQLQLSKTVNLRRRALHNQIDPHDSDRYFPREDAPPGCPRSEGHPLDPRPVREKRIDHFEEFIAAFASKRRASFGMAPKTCQHQQSGRNFIFTRSFSTKLVSFALYKTYYLYIIRVISSKDSSDI